jgi:hypothetical protein
MKDEEMAAAFLELVDEAGRDYATALRTPLAEATDPLYRKAIALHESLTPQERAALVAFARQAFIDGISTVLGVLDGTTPLGKHGFQTLELKRKGRASKVNGDLQDYFLAAIEEAPKKRRRR